MTEKPRLWGIDVIAVVYAIASLLLLLAFAMAGGIGRLIVGIPLLLCMLASYGLLTRINGVRTVLVVLLWVAIAGDILLGILYAGMACGVVEVPNGLDPVHKLVTLPIRIGLTVWMLIYLLRADVRAAFVGRLSHSQAMTNASG